MFMFICTILVLVLVFVLVSKGMCMQFSVHNSYGDVCFNMRFDDFMLLRYLTFLA